MSSPHAMKQSARILLLKKHASSLKAKKRLVVSVESVRPTPAVQEPLWVRIVVTSIESET